MGDKASLIGSDRRFFHGPQGACIASGSRSPGGATRQGFRRWLIEENAMDGEPKAGQAVSWSSHGGTARGKVVKKITGPTRIKGHKVAASEDNPAFIVETVTGKRAAHKAGALKKG
jgi:hypothetical protein